MILICRSLRANGLEINHIMEDGSMESNIDSEKRLMELLDIPQHTLFDSEEELINSAYDMQSEKIAYIIKDKGYA